MQPFDSLPSPVQKVLLQLEEKDRKEREVGLDRLQRLRQIPRETGEFLFQFLLTFSSQFPDFVGLEIGTSGGYSTIWQGMALVKNDHGRLISLDHDPKKFQFASKNITSIEVSQFIELIHGDAKDYLKKSQEKFNYVFLDCEKEDYLYFFNLLVNRLSRGTVLIADNVISHADDMQEFIIQIKGDSKVSSVILPVGRGLAFVRWI
ncbi:MAG: class I SAM-dependent methyltransferase [Candidatus Heimdallarchaeota archaeon]|nr:MAG: class I SAM-dependent methyltransferase [Candidatus Heimdallarchaeota archaeon]